MSLAFLSKKSWHTANLRNVEKVWIAEQKHAAEEKKVAELRKNIEEERQMQELRQLQAAMGNKSAAVERVDWMYEGPSAAREKTAEEFLLGKEYKGENEKEAIGDADLRSTTKYGSLALTKSVLPANDVFQRLNEDPMMLIRKRQQAAREQVLKNPVKMKKIKDEVDRLKEDKKARKKAKKAAKKEKKQIQKNEKRRVKKSKVKHGDESDEDGGKKTEYRHEKHRDRRHRGTSRDHERARSHSMSERRSTSPVSARDQSHYNNERERSGRSPAHRPSDRTKPSRHADEHRREKDSSRDRRVSKPATNSRYNSRSRSPNQRKKRGRSRNSRHQHDRDAFGRDRPSSRRTEHSPPRQVYGRSTGRRNEDHRERSCSRSPVYRREKRRLRSSVDRQKRSRSVSSSDRRDRQRSCSQDRRNEKHRGRVSPRRESTRKERSIRQHSRPDEHGRCSVEVRGHDQSRKEPESRAKPLDKDGKYGLISKAGAVESKNVDKTSLGPNANYLAKAREAKRLEEEERQRKLGKLSQKEARVLTDEEKKQMAQQMVEDAKRRDEYIVKRATLKKDELDKREQEATSSNPEFLRKLHSEAYLGGQSDMSDRLRRNAHYIQRNADSSNFLSK